MPFAIATANCKLSKWKSPPHRAINNTSHFNSYQHRSRPITLNCSIHSLITIQTHKMTKTEAFTTQPNPHRDNNYIIIVSLRTTTLLHDAFWSSHDDTNFDKRGRSTQWNFTKIHVTTTFSSNPWQDTENSWPSTQCLYQEQLRCYQDCIIFAKRRRCPKWTNL